MPDSDGRRALRCAQKLIDEVVIGCMRMNAQSIEVVVKQRLVDACSSLGLTPLFGVCYALWPEGARRLLAAGADPYEVGLGSALDAVQLGLRDAGASASAEASAEELAGILTSYGLDLTRTVTQELIETQNEQSFRQEPLAA